MKFIQEKASKIFSLPKFAHIQEEILDIYYHDSSWNQIQDEIHYIELSKKLMNLN